MANRQFQQFKHGLLKKPVELYCVFGYASSGNTVTLKKWDYAAKALASAPTATGITPYQTGDAGVKSIARNGTGIYTITLQDSYTRLLGVQLVGTVSVGGASTVVACGVWTVGTDVTAATPAIKVLLSSATATAADPADGDTVTLKILLQDSTEP